MPQPKYTTDDVGHGHRQRRVPRPIRRFRRGVSDLQRLFYPIVRVGAGAWGRLLGWGIKWSGSGPLIDLIESGQPVVICIWHQDIAPSMAFVVTQIVRRRQHPVTIMVGDGRAGSLGGAAATGAGVGFVTGGKRDPGGRVGVVQRLAEECVRTRASGVVTGDGSRGPAFEAKWGAVYLARDTGFPLVPLRTAMTHGFRLRKTWAGFHLPPILARGRAHAVSGEPIWVSADADKADLEGIRQDLERRLNDLIPVAEERLRAELTPDA